MKDRTLLSPWDGPMPRRVGDLAASLIVPVPVGAHAAVEPKAAVEYLGRLDRSLRKLFRGRFETLFIPFGEAQPASGLSVARLMSSGSDRKATRWLEGFHSGRGSAVRAGVFRSRGRLLLVASLEYFYDPAFYMKAAELLGRSSSPGVLANRRLPLSEFTVPVTLLPMVWRRHSYGVFLGKLWNRLLGLEATDSLSGGFVLRREFALRAFNRLTCPSFLYESEMTLLARVNGLVFHELPVKFLMEREKSFLRVLLETKDVAAWTWRLWRNRLRGDYRFLGRIGNRLTADDWGLSPAVNEGILELARSGVLKRVSILAGGRFLHHKLKELKKVQGIEFGLHFNLTNQESEGPYASPGRFLTAWMLGRRNLAEPVRKALSGQLDLLRKAGITARRLDGHHHVHAVPGLLDEITDILRKRGIRTVRAPYHLSLLFSKRAVIGLLGLSVLKAAGRLGLKTLPFFYPQGRDFGTVNRLARALRGAPDAEILVHPALRDDLAAAAPSDRYREERVSEFKALRMLALEIEHL